jgi:hypothetical protein
LDFSYFSLHLLGQSFVYFVLNSLLKLSFHSLCLHFSKVHSRYFNFLIEKVHLGLEWGLCGGLYLVFKLFYRAVVTMLGLTLHLSLVYSLLSFVY